MARKVVQGGVGWIESDDAAQAAAYKQVSLTQQAQVTQFIRVNGVLQDASGNTSAVATEVVVETFAQQDTSGAIATNTGTQRMNTGAPAGKLSTAVILTTSGGLFAFTIGCSGAGNEDILVRVTTNNGVVNQLNLHFINS